MIFSKGIVQMSFPRPASATLKDIISRASKGCGFGRTHKGLIAQKKPTREAVAFSTVKRKNSPRWRILP